MLRLIGLDNPANLHPLVLLPERVPLSAIVEKVHDGDTLHLLLLVRQKIRLDGIQAPELATDRGKQALAAMAGLVEGRLVTCTLAGDYKFGGEKMATVATMDVPDVGKWLIAQGLAVAWDGRGPRPVGRGVE